MELHHRYTFTTPQGAISTSGIDEILRLINRQEANTGEWLRLNPAWGRFYLPTLPDDWNYSWLTSAGEYRGKFTTRMSQFYFKRLGIKCPADFVNQIGNLARAHSTESETYEFEFVDSFDWQDGDYGDGGSCMWGGYAGGRLMLKENNALAMLFYGGRWGGGLGRAFLAPIENDTHIVFNGYGFPGDSTLRIARVFAQFRNQPYKQLDLDNQGTSGGQLWINSGRGFAVGTWAFISQLADYDLDWPEIYAYTCHSCGVIIDEDSYYHGADDMDYCESCFEELFTSCDRCGESQYRDETHETNDGQWLCRWCLEHHYLECVQCGERFPANAIVQIGYAVFCRDCATERKEEQAKK